MKIILLGTAYPYRGGLAAYNERLMLEWQQQGHDVEIITFSLQYPKFFFPGKTQYSNAAPPKNLPIQRLVDSTNPFNWFKIGKKIQKMKPDLLLIKYWTPFMAPCFGTISRIVQNNKHTKIITIVDNIIPHEKHFYDNILSKYYIKHTNGFIAMSQSVLNDINLFDKEKPKYLCPHPMFDNFGETVDREKALKKLGLSPDFRYFLFFGFIRSYKGLDWLLEAFSDKRLRNFPVKLIVAGEFYQNEEQYFNIIKNNNLEDFVIMHNNFIPDNEVANYFCASDLIVQPYKNATQSGVTQIGYHFSKPMLVTNVGGLSEIIPNKKAGYVVEPNIMSIADAMVDFLKNNKLHSFDESIANERKKYEWSRMTEAILHVMKLI